MISAMFIDQQCLMISAMLNDISNV